MAKIQTSLRIEEKSLHEAKIILGSLGMNFSEAVNVFTSMIVQTKGLPFEVKIPNKLTSQVIKEAKLGVNVDDFSINELR
ncbi:MAG: type II toxin-antitoxin system antitoxin, RelB/DinJ family [Gammaproteobacteria bacterium]|nr:MAG: type II toxin-antitoxin system antitoxin, RelB/DinJ family [Gammaproteobacteria bacterium]